MTNIKEGTSTTGKGSNVEPKSNKVEKTVAVKDSKIESKKETEKQNSEVNKKDESPKPEASSKVKKDESPKTEASSKVKKDESPKPEASKNPIIPVEAPPVPEDTKKKEKKVSFRKLALKDFGTWITRPVKDGDKDLHGNQIKSKTVFCLRQQDMFDNDLPAYPLEYDYNAKDDYGDDILVAYKKPQIRNSSRGITFKLDDGTTTTDHKYKQHTVMVEKLVEKSDLGIGLAGYWNTQLTPEDIAEIERVENDKKAAAAKKLAEKEAKKQERDEAAKKKAEELKAKAEAAAKAAEATVKDEKQSEADNTTEAPSKQKKETGVKAEAKETASK